MTWGVGLRTEFTSHPALGAERAGGAMRGFQLRLRLVCSKKHQDRDWSTFTFSSQVRTQPLLSFLNKTSDCPKEFWHLLPEGITGQIPYSADASFCTHL